MPSGELALKSSRRAVTEAFAPRGVAMDVWESYVRGLGNPFIRVDHARRSVVMTDTHPEVGDDGTLERPDYLGGRIQVRSAEVFGLDTTERI